ncbi:hypothetical protein BRADI_2g31796v3 [Brachypodium distachyon]|uniref:Uncharacterized protein n=1 Tax=Brachypodium distachyon TaxID=15368 RepID=A0A2K2DBD6_BRADI|nr:hypothetical protein BRADI_2g31796v3 [Brachypodium distachyon]
MCRTRRCGTTLTGGARLLAGAHRLRRARPRRRWQSAAAQRRRDPPSSSTGWTPPLPGRWLQLRVVHLGGAHTPAHRVLRRPEHAGPLRRSSGRSWSRRTGCLLLNMRAPPSNIAATTTRRSTRVSAPPSAPARRRRRDAGSSATRPRSRSRPGWPTRRPRRRRRRR